LIPPPTPFPEYDDWPYVKRLFGKLEIPEVTPYAPSLALAESGVHALRAVINEDV